MRAPRSWLAGAATVLALAGGDGTVLVAASTAGPGRPPATLDDVLHLAPSHALDGHPVVRPGQDAVLTVIYVWATWCGPCLHTLPKLTALDRALGDRGLRVIGLNVDMTARSRLVPWLVRHGVTWPQWHDGRGRNGPLARRLGVVGVPKLVVFDAAGRLVASDPSETHLRALLGEAFGEAGRPAPATTSTASGGPPR